MKVNTTAALFALIGSWFYLFGYSHQLKLERDELTEKNRLLLVKYDSLTKIYWRIQIREEMITAKSFIISNDFSYAKEALDSCNAYTKRYFQGTERDSLLNRITLLRTKLN